MIVTNSILLKKLEVIKDVNKDAYDRLKIWYEEIKDFEKLLYKDVKELNILMLEVVGNEKEIIREKLILGSLHFVFNFICESGLTAISTSVFDIDDIINTSIEIWIGILDKGTIANVDNRPFSTLYSTFYTSIAKLIAKGDGKKENIELEVDEKKSIKYDLGIKKVNNSLLLEIIGNFIDLINLGYDIDENNVFYEFTFLILKERGLLNKLDDISKRSLVSKVYDILRFIIKSSNINDISRLSRTDLEYWFNIYFLAYKFDDTFEIQKSDFILECCNKELLVKFRNFIYATDLLTGLQREILINYNGLNDGYFKTFEKMSMERGSSFQALHIKNKRALILVRDSVQARELANSFFDN